MNWCISPLSLSPKPISLFLSPPSQSSYIARIIKLSFNHCFSADCWEYCSCTQLPWMISSRREILQMEIMAVVVHGVFLEKIRTSDYRCALTFTTMKFMRSFLAPRERINTSPRHVWFHRLPGLGICEKSLSFASWLLANVQPWCCGTPQWQPWCTAVGMNVVLTSLGTYWHMNYSRYIASQIRMTQKLPKPSTLSSTSDSLSE